MEEIKKQGATDFSSKVAFVLDKIKCENDMAFYNEVSGLLVQLIVKVTEELSNGEPFFPVFENNSKEIFGNNAYMARAYLLQSIKDYSISVGFTDETRTTVFFDDLIRLM